MTDIVARQPSVPAPSVVAYGDVSEQDAWLRNSFYPVPSLVAYGVGPISVAAPPPPPPPTEAFLDPFGMMGIFGF